jgi:hypothetical protein
MKKESQYLITQGGSDVITQYELDFETRPAHKKHRRSGPAGLKR